MYRISRRFWIWPSFWPQRSHLRAQRLFPKPTSNKNPLFSKAFAIANTLFCWRNKTFWQLKYTWLTLQKISVVTFVSLFTSGHQTIDFLQDICWITKFVRTFTIHRKSWDFVWLLSRNFSAVEKCVRSEIGKVAWEFDNKFAFCTFVYKTERKVTFVLWKFHEILFKFSRFLNQDADVIVYKEVSKFPVIFCLPENHEESYSENAENIALTFSALDVFGKD